MIVSAIIGLVFREDVNPFSQVDKKHKILYLIQIAVMVVVLSSISTFLRIFRFDFSNGVLFPLIILSCFLGIILIRKRNENLTHFFILINTSVILAFIITHLTLPERYGHGEWVTTFPPLSYPLILYQREALISIPNPNRFFSYYSLIIIGFVFPFFGIACSNNSLQLSYNLVGYEKMMENVRDQNQFFIFLLFFSINYLTTLGTMKFYVLYKNKINLTKMLNITCRITTLLANMLIIFFIVPIFISYWKNRLFGQLFLEEISSIIYLSIAVIIMLAIGVIFHRYPLLQKNDYRKTKELGFIGILGVILLLSTLITELFFPNLNTQFSNYAFSFLSFIIVDLIIVITTLTILFKPLSLEYAIESEEIPNST